MRRNVKNLEHIFHDGTAWSFSSYFEYLRTVADLMPETLRSFSQNVEHYHLRGNKTLHDARVMSVVVNRNFDPSFSTHKTSVDIALLDQMFEGRILLSYENVSSLEISDSCPSDSRPCDILLHEVTVKDEVTFQHRIVDEKGGGICIVFSGFRYEWTRLDS